MFTRGAFFLCIVLFHGVVSIPLKALIGDGPPGNIAKIKEATTLANDHISKMQTVLNGPTPHSHPAVVAAFGNNANIEGIKQNVDTLATGKIRVPDSSAVPGYTLGATNTATKDVAFGSTFFSSDAHTRAGTVIHESAHALHGAVDHFDQHGNPHPQGSTFDRTKAQVGYKDSHLDQLKNQASHNMHHNADSYRVFAEQCSLEARAFFRRAFEGRDPVAQTHLMRRAASACARRPKAASKTPAAKAPVKKASGQKTAKAGSSKPIRPQPVAKKAGSRRPVRARPVANSKAGAKPAVASKKVAASKTPAAKAPVKKASGQKTAKAGSSKPIQPQPVAKKAGSRSPVRARPAANSKAGAKPAVAPKKVAASKTPAAKAPVKKAPGQKTAKAGSSKPMSQPVAKKVSSKSPASNSKAGAKPAVASKKVGHK